MRIAICSPQVPFARGGAEILAERLTEELQARGHEADLVTIPFKWYPGEKVLTHALMWRLLDLDEVDGRTVDLVIGTKFPSYVVRHPNKVVWLVHQFRQAYELDRTDLGQFDESPQQRALRRKLHDLAERHEPAAEQPRARLRGRAAAAAGARLPLRRVRRLHPLGQPARPREANRPSARGRQAAGPPGRRGGRRPRPAAARSARER